MSHLEGGRDKKEKKEKKEKKKVIVGRSEATVGGRVGYYVAALSFSSISSDIPLSRGGQASEWI